MKEQHLNNKEPIAPISNAIFLYPFPFVNESRMLREISSLKKFNILKKVIVIGTKKTGLDDVETINDGFTKIIRLKLEESTSLGRRISRLFGIYFWSKRVVRYLSKHSDFSIIHCHSLSVLPIAKIFKKKHNISIIYDAHELESERTGLSYTRRIISKIYEKHLIRFIDEAWVVGDQIRKWYKRKQGLDAKVVCNYPLSYINFNKIEKDNFDLRKKFKIPNTAILYLYQGNFGKGRCINLLLSWFKEIDDNIAHIIFMGDGFLKDSIQAASEISKNIHYHQQVSPAMLLHYTKTADIGIVMFKPISLSFKYVMPNKLFEYIQAGIAVWASDLTELRKVITDVKNGILIKGNISNKEAIKLINSIRNDQIIEWKMNVRLNREKYSWEQMEPTIIETYRKLLKLRNAN